MQNAQSLSSHSAAEDTLSTSLNDLSAARGKYFSEVYATYKFIYYLQTAFLAMPTIKGPKKPCQTNTHLQIGEMKV